eukprot:TRINITY_DN1539_c0_g1_i2.p1 TRINITY_DN1539_c0_g1~~TRINITY_DN1539_c0_g1_i2.p1  ORF type:complete len:448 (-),score=98.06 TRINITY_DN1539_c0_g1_i2:346-1689(-)
MSMSNYIRRAPTVRFSAVVFLATDEDVEKFSQAMQIVAQRVVKLSLLCESSEASFESKQSELLVSIEQMKPHLDTLVHYSAELSSNLDRSPLKQRFVETNDKVVACAEQFGVLLQSLISTDASGRYTMASTPERGQAFQKLMDAILELLNHVLELLKLQDEDKFANVLEIAKTCTVFVKEVRDSAPDPPTERLKAQAMPWLEILPRVAEERAQIMDADQQKRMMTAAAKCRLEYPKLFAPTLTERRDAVARMVHATTEIVQIIQAYRPQFAMSFTVEREVDTSGAFDDSMQAISRALDNLMVAAAEGETKAATQQVATIVEKLNSGIEAEDSWKVGKLKDQARKLVPVVKSAIGAKGSTSPTSASLPADFLTVARAMKKDAETKTLQNVTFDLVEAAAMVHKSMASLAGTITKKDAETKPPQNVTVDLVEAAAMVHKSMASLAGAIT